MATNQARGHVTVVGSLNMDLVARAPRLPQPGETLAGHAFAQVAGGKGGNQAVAAARLGAQVSMLGCVGADGNGAQLRAGLEAEILAGPASAAEIDRANAAERRLVAGRVGIARDGESHLDPGIDGPGIRRVEKQQDGCENGGHARLLSRSRWERPMRDGDFSTAAGKP